MAAKKCLICNSLFRGRVDAKTCSPRCRKRLQQLRFSLTHNERPANKPGGWRKAATLFIVGLFGVLGIFMASGTPQRVQALTASNYLNFQGRLLNAGGAVVPDGNYNIDFRIYNTSNGTLSGTGGSVGTCSGACLWEETHLVAASQGVSVTNGYYSVNLGAITSFPSTINWDQQLYMTMNVTTNGTTSCTPATSCTWNGEMQNSGTDIAITSVPLAFRANQLAVAGTNEQILQFANGTFGQATTISLQDPGATTANLCYETGTAVNHTCAAATGGSGYIQNQVASPQSANFNIISSAAGNTNTIHANAGQSADILDINDSGSTVLLGINSNGTQISLGATNTTIAATASGSSLSVQANGTGQLNLNTTTTGAVSIGNGTGSVTSNGNTSIASNKSFTANGTAKFNNATNSTTAFTIQNANSNNLLNVDTSTTNNLLTNSGFENSTNGWSVRVSASLSQNTSNSVQGNDSLDIATAASNNSGTEYDLNYVASKTYYLSFYAKVTSGSISTFNFGRSNDTGASDTACATGQTLNTTWQRFTCSWSVGSSPSGTNYIYFIQSDNVARHILLDAVQLENSNTSSTFTAYSPGGALQLLGLVESPLAIRALQDSSNVFQVQNNAGNNYINVDTAGAKLSLGDGGLGNTIQVGNTSGAVNQTINIGTNATSGATNTIHIGDAATATDTITIGSSNVAGDSVAINGGTSSTALQIQVGSGGTIGIANNAVSQNVTIGNSTGGTITIGASSGSDLALNDAQWSVTGAGAASFVGVNFGSSTLQGTGPVSLDLTGSNAINIASTSYSGTITIGNGSVTAINILGATNINNSGSANTGIGAGSSGTITIGSSSAGNVDIETGGTLTLVNNATAGTVNIGNNLFQGNITIGNTGLNQLSLQSANSIIIANASSPAVNIGTGSYTGTITIGNGSVTDLKLFVGGTGTTHGVCRNVGGSAVSGLRPCSGAAGADYAELYPTESSVHQGDLVMSNGNYVTSKDGRYQEPVLKDTQTSYDSGEIGVISEQVLVPDDGQPTLAGNNINSQDNPQALALNGRVLTKVDTENGNIAPGDYITASSTPGVGMKATHAGEVVGRALGSYGGSGVSQILVFINPSYYNPDNNIQGDSGSFDLVTANGITVNNLTVNGTATFNGSIVVNGHIVGNPDTSGVVTVRAGDNSLSYTFTSSFDSPPNVVITPESDPGGLRYWVTKTADGFTIHLSGTAVASIKFDYFVQQ